MPDGQHDKDMGIVIINPDGGKNSRTIRANYWKVSLSNFTHANGLGATGIMEIYDDETTEVSDEAQD